MAAQGEGREKEEGEVGGGKEGNDGRYRGDDSEGGNGDNKGSSW